MAKLLEVKWSETKKRVDFKVEVSRLFSSSYEFTAHVVGDGFVEDDLDDIIDRMVEMIDNEQYKISKKKATRVFPMRARWNATGYIYAKNFPQHDSERT